MRMTVDLLRYGQICVLDAVAILEEITQVKMKTDNSHAFDVHWLYRMSCMPSLSLTSLNIIMLLNVTVVSSQYG